MSTVCPENPCGSSTSLMKATITRLRSNPMPQHAERSTSAHRSQICSPDALLIVGPSPVVRWWLAWPAAPGSASPHPPGAVAARSPVRRAATAEWGRPIPLVSQSERQLRRFDHRGRIDVIQRRCPDRSVAAALRQRASPVRAKTRDTTPSGRNSDHAGLGRAAHLRAAR